MKKSEIKVRYAETDKMGVVYHANYLVWLELARTEYLEEIGLKYRELEEEGVLVPVLGVNCKYHSPARYDDMVMIETEMQSLKRARCMFSYRVVRASDGQLLATAETEHTFVDRDFKPLNLKRDFPDIWEKLQIKKD